RRRVQYRHSPPTLDKRRRPYRQRKRRTSRRRGRRPGSGAPVIAVVARGTRPPVLPPVATPPSRPAAPRVTGPPAGSDRNVPAPSGLLFAPVRRNVPRHRTGV